jgi:hypothetical protein
MSLKSAGDTASRNIANTGKDNENYPLAQQDAEKGPGTSHSDHRLKSVPPVISDLAAHGGTGFSL